MQEVQSTLSIGTVLRDRYVVEDLLGKGGFGAVYLVRDKRVKGNLFALKEMIDSSKQERARFAFECQVLTRLDSPALPRVYRVFEDDKNNRAYMLMDYIEGPNLETLRQKQPDRRFSLSKVMSMMAPIINAVEYLHHQQPPIIHRDIKPANIIVPNTGDTAVLVDFGIAKEFDPDSTTTAVRRCSPGYGAPEQYSRGTNTRTDIYGLGATFYTLLTGFVPEDAFYRMTQMGSRGIDPLEPVNKLVPTIPLPVAEAIHKAMSINVADRYASVEQFWQALNAYPGGEKAAAAIMEPVTPIPPLLMSQADIADMKTETSAPQLQPRDTDTHTRRRGFLLPVLLGIIALALVLGVAAAFWTSTTGHQNVPIVPTTHPTAVVHQKATPTPKATLAPSPTTKPTQSPSPTPVQTTPTPVPAVYPRVGGTHYGTVHNTNAGVDASLTLSLQQNQSQIGGNVTINSPLQGSGSIYNGFVRTNSYIQFTVTGYNGNAPLLFSGTVHADGSMGGNYCSIDSTGKCNANVGGQGNWSAGPSPSPSGSSYSAPSGQNIYASMRLSSRKETSL
ncbi:MAG: serine/threonine protein kinase [Ktedonobacteraceae bacterium]